jgi:hypothetical protein
MNYLEGKVAKNKSIMMRRQMSLALRKLERDMGMIEKVFQKIERIVNSSLNHCRQYILSGDLYKKYTVDRKTTFKDHKKLLKDVRQGLVDLKKDKKSLKKYLNTKARYDIVRKFFS